MTNVCLLYIYNIYVILLYVMLYVGDKSKRVPVTNVGLLEQLLVAQWGAKVKARMKIENTFYGYVITKHLLL